jgi:hypothetical protein
MFVWKGQNRRDRRLKACNLSTPDTAELEALNAHEFQLREDGEITRKELEEAEIGKTQRKVHGALESYFETRNGKDEVTAVGGILMNMHAEAERVEAADEKAKALEAAEEDDEKGGKTKKKKAKKAAKELEEQEQVIEITNNAADRNANSATAKLRSEKKKQKLVEKESNRLRKLAEKAAEDDANWDDAAIEKHDKPLDPNSVEVLLSLPHASLTLAQKMKIKVYHVFNMFDADAR